MNRLDLETALQTEAHEPSNLLPTRTVEIAVAAESDRILRYLLGRVRSGSDVPAPEVLSVAKSSRGFRPLHILDLETRVRYRSLVDLLTPRISTPDRSDEAYETFKRGVVAESVPAFVVRADVSSFYQFVDHELLAHEIVQRTGDSGAADAIANLLGRVMGRRFGLPQNRGPSHVLADLYIDVIERRLVRAGYATWRYNDDFAIAASSIGKARRILEALDEQLRSIGLTLNDEKSLIHPGEEYLEWLDAPAMLKQQVSDDQDLDLDAWILLPSSEYAEVEDEEDSPVEDDAPIAGAVRALDLWHDYVTSSEESDPKTRYVYRQLARDAIRLMRRQLSASALPYVVPLIEYEPQLTHTICRYLRRLSFVDADAARIVGRLVEEKAEFISTWQALWLLEPLTGLGVEAGTLDWVRRLMETGGPLIQARACRTLARFDRVSDSDIGRLFDRATPASKPELVAAMVEAGAPERVLSSVAQENELLASVAASATHAVES